MLKAMDPLVLLAGGISAALLGGAFAFQYIGGLAPCELCLLQRWAHVWVLVAVLAALAAGRGVLAQPARILGMLASLASVGIAGFHVGVENGWWDGLKSCSGAAEDLGAMSGAELLNMSLPAPVVSCSDVAWSMAGLSMAGWNALISVVLVLIWMVAILRFRNGKGAPAGAPSSAAGNGVQDIGRTYR